jgi:hypothetical protein
LGCDGVRVRDVNLGRRLRTMRIASGDLGGVKDIRLEGRGDISGRGRLEAAWLLEAGLDVSSRALRVGEGSIALGIVSKAPVEWELASFCGTVGMRLEEPSRVDVRERGGRGLGVAGWPENIVSFSPCSECLG